VPEATIASPWIKREAVAAENAREVLARRERERASLEAYEARLAARRSERGPLAFYCSDRARLREPIL
jgi:hypothetical protein